MPGPYMTLIFMYRSLRVAATLTAIGLTAACGSGGTSAGDAHVEATAAFYPLEYVTQQVGGNHVHVENLVKPGAEPHDLELSPRQLVQLSDAGLVVYLSGFQPNVDEAVAQEARDSALDVATVAPLLDEHALAGGHSTDGAHSTDDGHGHSTGRDPHIWLDPTRLADVADAVAARLGKLDAKHAGEFTTNAAALRTKLTALDTEYKQGLATCATRSLVVSHEAFGYLAHRYDLHQIPITGHTPEAEPTAARLAEVAKIAKQEKAKVIFFETLVSPKIAETLAQEVGARAEVLDPLEGLRAGSNADYISVMRSNLATLRSALGCS
jgi:zinc transport system substrate-binding protein